MEDTQKHYEEKQEAQSDDEQLLETYNTHDEKSEDTHHEETQKIQDDHEQKLETQNDHQEELISENEQVRESENEHEQNPHTEIDDEQKVETEDHEHEQSNEIHQSSSFHNDNEEQINEDEIKRPESVSLTNNHDEPFIESNPTSPIDELKSHSDPMTTSFVDGVPQTQNPFTEKTENNDDEEMEIIHHDISTSNKHPMPAIEEINPQGLPIENNTHSKKPLSKKLSNGSNR